MDSSISFSEIKASGAFKAPSRFKELPAIFFDESEITELSSRFDLAIVGRFPSGRPNLALIRKIFDKVGFSEAFTVSLLDATHILIRFSSNSDFLRCLLRKSWSIDGYKMLVFRWTHDFDPCVESPLSPVWIGLEGLPIHLFAPTALYSIFNLIGLPLKIDKATAQLSRPAVARICVEVDLPKELPNSVWLHLGKLSFLQPIHYEDLPSFCNSCRSFGHKNCKIKKASSRWIRREGKEATMKANSDGLKALPSLLPNESATVVQSASDALIAETPSASNSSGEANGGAETNRATIPLVRLPPNSMIPNNVGLITFGSIDCLHTPIIDDKDPTFTEIDAAANDTPIIDGNAPTVPLNKSLDATTNTVPPTITFAPLNDSLDATAITVPPQIGTVPMNVFDAGNESANDNSAQELGAAHSTPLVVELEGTQARPKLGDDDLRSDPNVPTRNKYELLADPMISDFLHEQVISSSPNTPSRSASKTMPQTTQALSKMSTRRATPPIIEGFVTDREGKQELSCEGYTGPFMFLGPPGTPREDGKRPRTAIPTKQSPHSMVNVWV